MRMGPGRVVIGVELDPDPAASPAALDDEPRDPIHRVTVNLLHIVLGKADHVGRLHPRRKAAAGRVHRPTDPNGLHVLQRNEDDLRRIERPAVIAGDVVLIGDIGHHQEGDVPAGHVVANARQASGIFATVEG
jgi:hypothetical protein